MPEVFIILMITLITYVIAESGMIQGFLSKLQNNEWFYPTFTIGYITL
jgi:hypothetical protein